MRPALFSVLLLPAYVSATLYQSFADVPKGTTFDFVIVGGGAAGSVLANRLSANAATSVLLLEAGPSNIGVLDSEIPLFPQTLMQSPYDWNYTTAPQTGFNGRSINYPRGFILGGSTSINYMAYTRGTSEEWDRYARLSGDAGWSWVGIQKYLRLNERLTPPADHHNTAGQYNPAVHSTTGINSVSLPGYSHAMDALVIATTKQNPTEFPFRLDMNAGEHLGVGWLQATIDGGQRSSAATSYLGSQFISRPNLHVVVNTRATRLIQTGTSAGKPAFRSVEFVSNSTGLRQVVAASKEVLLSAGSIGSTQLLLLSGIGSAHDLSALGIKSIINNPSVGRNLSDHPLLINMWSVNSNSTFDPISQNATIAEQAVEAWAATQQGPLVDSPLGHLVWKRMPQSAVPTPDPAAGPNTAHYELLFANGWAAFSPVPPTGSFLTIATAVTAPSSRGALTLLSPNPFDQPSINPNLLGTAFDLATMIQAVHAIRDFVAAPAWKNYIIAEVGDFGAAKTDAQLTKYIQANTGTVFHPVGTASMSPVGAAWGVVDPDLRVKGAVGLRVVDASVLPIVPSAHTQVPVYIVGERGADLIQQTYHL